jgi:cytochrome c551/c552
LLRSIAELAAYGTLAVLLAMASVVPEPQPAASSAATRSPTRESTTIRADDPSPTAGAQRGALLFAAKGCVGCHMHAALPNARMQVGPALTDLAARAATQVVGLDARAYVRQSLREPDAFRADTMSSASMPIIPMTDEQLESLTEFLLASRR